MRTVQGYSGMLYRFFRILGKPPDQVTATEVFSYAHGTGGLPRIHKKSLGLNKTNFRRCEGCSQLISKLKTAFPYEPKQMHLRTTVYSTIC